MQCRTPSAPPPIGAVEQGNAEIRLQISQKFGRCGLGDVEVVGGMQDARPLRDRDQQVQLPDLQPRQHAVGDLDVSLLGGHDSDITIQNINFQ